MGILSNLFKQKSAGTKFESRKPRYQSSGSSNQEPESADNAAANDDIQTPSPEPVSSEQPLKSISFGASKKSAPASPATQKKNIASTPTPAPVKSIRKTSVGRENAIPDKPVIIDLDDVLPQIPAQLLKAGRPVGEKKELRFNSYDLLQGLKSGKASAPLSRIIELVPEIFADQQPGENVQIALPLQKVVSQIGAFPCRPDQMEVQFPPLDAQYANLIVEKGGEAAAITEDVVEPPPQVLETSEIAAGEKNEEVAKSSAIEIPAEVPAAPIEPAPAPQAEQEAPAAEIVEEVEPTPEILPEPPPIEEKVSYSLAALWTNVPKSWLAGEAKSVSDDARITVPFHLVESQLVTGRVELAFADFLEGVPEDFKNHFSGDSEENKAARLQIPLHEVFQNLPGVEPLPPSPKPAAVEVAEEKAEAVEEKIVPVAESAESILFGEMKSPAVEAKLLETAAGFAAPEPVFTSEPVVKEQLATESQEQKIEMPKTQQAEPPVELQAPESTPAPAIVPESAEKSEAPAAPVEVPAQASEPVPEPPAVPLPVYREPPEIPSQVAAELAPPKVQLQRVTPPSVFAKEFSAAPPEIPAPGPGLEPEPEPGKILAFEGASLAFNPNAVETLFMTDGKLDAHKTAQHVSHFPGVQGVVFTGGNEMSTAGEIPQSFNTANKANAATVMFQALDDPSEQAGQIPVRDVTLRHGEFSSTWFKQGHILLGILHPQRSLEEALHNKLVLVTEELAQLH